MALPFFGIGMKTVMLSDGNDRHFWCICKIVKSKLMLAQGLALQPGVPLVSVKL